MKKDIKKRKIKVKDNFVSIMKVGNIDYISLTDLAKYQNSTDPSFTIKNWLRRSSTIDYVGLWEKLHNINFNLVEFDQIKNEYGRNSFAMSPTQWIKRTSAIGFISKGGRYSIGTYAHPDIAFEFASWLSPEFKLYLITEFERLKQKENQQNKIRWSVRRELAKTNYKIHTESIKENLIPTLNEKQKKYIYSSEADLINVALFGLTAKEWKIKNPSLSGNIRDYANILQLVILSNLENLNSEMIEQGLEQAKRLERLNRIAKKQYDILQDNNNIKKIEEINNNNNFEILKIKA